MTDYYQALGVQRNATDDEIKRAYRRAAMKHHPDRGGDQAQFQQIQEAYATLSDPDRRRQYDNPHVRINVNGRPFRSAGGAFDFDTIFEMFGARMGPRDNKLRQQRITIWLSLDIVVAGGPRTISVGTPQGNTTMEINIPRGIQDNENVRYPGLAPGGQDLVVNFRVHPHPQWQREGLDLWCERAVDFWQLILGDQITVHDVLGRELQLTVPLRCKPGTVLRACGRGIARNGHTTGDLMVRVQAQMPTEIPDEIIEILNKMRNNK
jgi:curved DNA-binding protein